MRRAPTRCRVIGLCVFLEQRHQRLGKFCLRAGKRLTLNEEAVAQRLLKFGRHPSRIAVEFVRHLHIS